MTCAESVAPDPTSDAAQGHHLPPSLRKAAGPTVAPPHQSARGAVMSRQSRGSVGYKKGVGVLDAGGIAVCYPALQCSSLELLMR